MAVRENFFSSAKWEETAGYSRAVKVGPFVYVAGTTATSQENGELLYPGDVYGQSKQIWENIKLALSKAGASMSDVVRTRMFVVNIAENGPIVAKAHSEYFQDVRPASTMVGIEKLYTPDMLVEFGAFPSSCICFPLHDAFPWRLTSSIACAEVDAVLASQLGTFNTYSSQGYQKI
jgi:enamine deaminase RidA (YjgF/YER057c/UK114 family)